MELYGFNPLKRYWVWLSWDGFLCAFTIYLTDAFYDAMGPDEDAEESSASSEDDSEATSEKPELYHVSDESGEMKIEKIGEGSFEQDTLLDKVMSNSLA